MFDLKTIVTASITAVAVVMLMGLVGGTNGVGGETRFPNSNLSAKSFELNNGSATTTFVADKMCIQGTESDGTTIYYYFGPIGKWATSSTACN